MSKRTWNYRRASVVLFFIATTVRLFHQYPVVHIINDEATYLATARDFPLHRLYNREVYLMHGPGYPALVRLGMILLPDYLAGIAASLAMWGVAFWALGWLGRLAGLDRTGVLLARGFLAFLPMHIDVSQSILKEATMVALYTLLLAGFLESHHGRRRGYWVSAIAGGYLAFTADQHVPLVLLSLAAIWICGSRRAAAWVCVVPMLLVWAGWVCFRRIYFAAAGPLVPVGIDGLPEVAGRLGWLNAIVQPSAPETMSVLAHWKFLTSLRGAKDFLVGFFLPLNMVPRFYPILFWWYRLLALSIPFGMAAGFWRVRSPRRRWRTLGLVLAALIMVGIPMLRGLFPRYSLLAAVPLACTAGRSSSWLPRGRRRRALWVVIGPAALLVAAGMFYARSSRFLVFACDRAVETEVVSRWLDTHATAGILAQIGYPPELAYQTDRRVLAMPVRPEMLDEAIRAFNISHIVVSTAHKEFWGSAKSIDYLLQHPERFRPVADLPEPALPGRPENRFLVLEVLPDRSSL